MNKFLHLIMAVALLCVVSAVETVGQTTAFTYQGQLSENGGPAAGLFDFKFTVFDAATEGTAVGGEISFESQNVTNGFFTIALDFGAAVFDGSDRWLEIGVTTNGGSVFETLTPRQPFTSAPYAMTAGNVIGVVPSGGVSGTYEEPVSFNNANNTFFGNGSQLIKVDAASLNGVKAAGFWQLGGNSGTTAGVDFIGTTDAQPLDLRVGGARGLRIEPTTNSSTVNIVAGSTGNFAGASAVGVTIAGGGSESLEGFVGTNSVAASFGSIGGGFNNHINVGADFAGIASGAHNELQSKAFISTISGGRLNVVGSDAQFGVIAGGSNNRVGAGAVAGVIGGGVQNLVDDGAVHATVGGGNLNTIGDSSITSTIGGGFNNLVQTGVSSATIAGGRNNIVGPGSDNTTISGGVSNVVNLSAIGATIGGGANNTVIAVAQYGTVPGGEQNTAGGKWSFAAGRRANAGAEGSFVWGDSTDETVFAPNADTFTVRASNGVHLTQDAGSAKAVSLGERYRDNAVVAWARIASTGTVNADFGIVSVVRNGVGSYTVNTTAAAQLGTTLIPMAVAEVDVQPTSASTVRLVSVNQKTATLFDVYINNGSFAPVDNDFLFMVTGR